MRDARAREVDRPAFKVLGNRTLLEIAEKKPRKLADLAEIKGITELIVRRMGREIMAAVKAGRAQEHGPIPRLNGGSRRRMDRGTERRLEAAIAFRDPAKAEDLVGLKELKGWFVREFGEEVTAVVRAVAPVAGS
jgi:ribonuclease D